MLSDILSHHLTEATRHLPRSQSRKHPGRILGRDQRSNYNHALSVINQIRSIENTPNQNLDQIKTHLTTFKFFMQFLNPTYDLDQIKPEHQ